MRRTVSIAGFAAGMASAVALLLGGAVPEGAAAPGLDLRLVADLTGELDVAPVGAFAAARGMRPAPGRDRIAGAAWVTNQTPVPLEVRAVAGVADDTVRPALVTTARLGRGPAGRPVVLRAGERARLRVTAVLRRGAAADRAAGLATDVGVRFRTRPVRR